MPRVEFDVPASLGERVFLIVERFKEDRVRCGFCGGAGEVSGMDGDMCACPGCRGSRFNVNHVKYWSDGGKPRRHLNDEKPWEFFVESYTISIDEGVESVSGVLGAYLDEGYVWDDHPIEDLFLTQEELDAEIERRNAALEEQS